MVNEVVLNPEFKKYSNLQLSFLAFLRIVVGWHFLYEGYYKMSSSAWSAGSYLTNVPGPFSGMFKTLAKTPWMLDSIDSVMMYGLVAIGLALILGLFTRLASAGAAILLILFYFSNPPWVGVHFMPGEGNYLIVNKNVVEFAAVLILLVFPSGLVMGFDKLFKK